MLRVKKQSPYGLPRFRWSLAMTEEKAIKNPADFAGFKIYNNEGTFYAASCMLSISSLMPGPIVVVITTFWMNVPFAPVGFAF